MNLAVKKYNLIQLIMLVADEQVLDRVSDELRQSISAKEEPISENLSILEEPISSYGIVIKEEIDLEQIKKEQNYQGFDPDEMDRLVEEADIQEPIEDLLKMI